MDTIEDGGLSLPSFPGLVVVSEREPGGWEDCTWATGVMLGNYMLAENRYPATRFEYEELRFAATGTREVAGDGSNYRELETGMLRRYGFTGRRGSGWDAALEAAPVGTALALQGRSEARPLRLQPIRASVGHSLLWVRDRADSGLQYDPLEAPGASPRRASVEEMRTYFEALRGAEFMAGFPLEAHKESTMILFNLQRAYIPAGTPVYEFPGGPIVAKIATSKTFTTLGLPMDRRQDGSPGVDYSFRVVLLESAALDGKVGPKLAYVARSALSFAAAAPEWDAAVWRALLDPEFRGGEVIDATAAQIAAAEKKGYRAAIDEIDAEVEARKE